MIKKRISFLLVLTLVVSMALVGCGAKSEDKTKTEDKTNTEDTSKIDEKTIKKVAMATDSGSIDDKSFNQGTWEGIEKYQADKGTIEGIYTKPAGTEHADYVTAINTLIDAGNEIIVTPGFMFGTAVNESAKSHPDTKYILIDGMPTEEGSYDFVKHDNVVSIYFAEHEAGFLAGITAALSSETGKVGYIGGMEIPAVQKFGWGFKAGVKHANEKFGTNVVVDKYHYQGSFTDIAGGSTTASGMYDSGIDIIFTAAGGTGTGVFNEAKERAEKGSNVKVIGVDVDQFTEGLLKDGKTSVTLTSAVKGIGLAAYNYIDAELNGTFPGGEILNLTLKEDAVGLPQENPNLSEEILTKVEEVKKEVVAGNVVVPATEADLEEFLK